jgi:hypothetical protein
MGTKMPNYKEFMMRHGEFGVQKIVEQIEQVSGIKSNSQTSLEQRWLTLTQTSPSHAPVNDAEAE